MEILIAIFVVLFIIYVIIDPRIDIIQGKYNKEVYLWYSIYEGRIIRRKYTKLFEF